MNKIQKKSERSLNVCIFNTFYDNYIFFLKKKQETIITKEAKIQSNYSSTFQKKTTNPKN